MRFFIIIGCCFCSLSIYAQVRIGIEGGINLSKFVIVDHSGKSANNSYKSGWFRGGQIGLVAEKALSHKVFLKSGLRINGKGTVLNTQTSFDTSKTNIEVHYAEVPVLLLFKRNSGKANFIYGGFGLYAARAVRGVEWGKGRYISGSYTMHSKVEFSNENPHQSYPMVIKPFDWGYIVLGGFEHKRFQLSLGTELSLSPILPNSKIYYLNFRNAEISISASYYIFRPNF